MRKLLLLALILSLFGSVMVTFAQDDSGEATPEATPESIAENAQTPQDLCASATPRETVTREFSEAPANVLDPTVDYYAVLCTEFGPVVVNLFEDIAPLTVNNFVFLAESGYYDGLTFHRVIADFMVQGGDPLGTGTGGPGYEFRDEFATFVTFDRPGLLAMANSGANTNGSQFFITTVVTDWLNYAHTIFGEVVEGQTNVEAIPVTEVQAQTSIDTVHIITDPSTLAIDYASPAPATREELASLIGTFPELNIVVPDEAMTGDFDSADYVALLPAEVQDAAGQLFETYNHEYTISVVHTNQACNLVEFPIEKMNLQLHVFASAEDASAAAQDEAFNTLLTSGAESEPFTADFTGLSGVSYDAATLCDADVQASVLYRVVGRFIMVTEVVYTTDSGVTPQDLDALNANLYEGVFFDVLRAEASR